MTAPTRIAMLDGQLAILAGFEAIVASQPDLRLVGVASREMEFRCLVHRAEPEVVVLDVGGGGLDLCLEINRLPSPPAAVLYAVAPHDGLVVGAALAGAGAVVSKHGPVEELLDAIRTLAIRPRAVAPIPTEVRRKVAARLDPSDYPIVAMRLAGEPATEIGKTLGMSALAIQKRLARILARLEPVHGTG
jgi:DNA-binding NarL/FixJ family response regulator